MPLNKLGTKSRGSSAASAGVEIDEDSEFDEMASIHEHEEEDEKLLEDLEDKEMLKRIQTLEEENSSLTEKIWKLEHGRSWVENRLTALEAGCDSRPSIGCIA